MESEEKIAESKDKKEVDIRKDKVWRFIKKYYIYAFILVLILLAWNVRTVNVSGLVDITTNDCTLGPDLDPFLFLRYAQNIVENGSLMKNDSLRYVPLGYNTAQETQLLPYMIAYFHKILNVFTNTTINCSAVYFPAFMFVLTILAFFLFIRKIFQGKKYKNGIAFLASLLLIVSPSLVARTVAGIPEKESAGFFFLFLAFYLFLSAWKEKSRKSIIFAALAGVATGLMGLIWGGVMFVFIVIGAAAFLAFIFGKVDKKEFYVYTIWLMIAIIIMPLFSERFKLISMFVSTSSGMGFGVFLILLSDFLLFKTKLKDNKKIKRIKGKIPNKLFSIIAAVLVIIIASSLFLGVDFIPNFFGEIIDQLMVPYSDRLSFTVAENRQPYFDEWMQSFGPAINILGGIPLTFWLFFIGSIFLFYGTVRKINKKDRSLLTLAYIIFLFALIFSRYSASSTMNGDNSISKLVYFGGGILFLLSFVYIFYKYNKEKKLEEFQKIDYNFLFLLVYFIIGLVGARSAVRLIMTLAPPAVGIISYFCFFAIDKARGEKEKTKKLSLQILALIVVVSVVYSFIGNPITNQPGNYHFSIGYAKSMIPSFYTYQWQKAMEWVRNNTDKEAVFSHWWDYGYWIQSIGERATVLDGGNAIAYWNHLLGRHVLTGQSEREALEFLYTHDTDYLLIDSTDIGKYPAYSSIGSDENYDRYSQVVTFSREERYDEEGSDYIQYAFLGGTFLEEDYLYYENEKEIFFPAYNTGIGGVIIQVNKNQEVIAARVVFVYNNNQYNLPLRYVYFNNNLFDLGEGYNGALYIYPNFFESNGQQGIQADRVGFFLSERAMRTLWVKLYLFENSEYFELVHKQDSLVIENIKNQGIEIGDFIQYSGFQGPIKIWKINYPADIQKKEEYLQTEYPDSVRLARDIF